MNPRPSVLLAAVLLLVPRPVPCAGEPPALRNAGRPICLDLRDAPVADIFRVFSEMTGNTFVVDPSVRGRTVTVDLTDVPWEKALDQILESTDLTKSVGEDGTITILPPGGAGPGRSLVLEARLFRGMRAARAGITSETLFVGNALTVIDTHWADSVARQAADLEETFGLESADLVAERRAAEVGGKWVRFADRGGREPDFGIGIDIASEPAATAPGRVALQVSLAIEGQRFLETSIVAPDGESVLLGGRHGKTGEFWFLALTVWREGGREISMSAVPHAGDPVVTPPVLLARVDPVYPEDLLAAGVEGEVVLEVLLGAGGEVQEIRVLRSDHPGLAESAKKAVRGWKYSPARVGGKPSPVSLVVRVAYRPEGK